MNMRASSAAREFEPKEENPMIGFRGASRYYSPQYRDGFALECRAIRRLREEMGFTNVVVMIPFCRSPDEADRVLEVMAENGLTRGENGLEVYVMCEIPSNVILAAAFAERFDGFSIGSNDLTQLTLGVDRDSELLAGLFDEQDEAVKWMIRKVIERCPQGRAPNRAMRTSPERSSRFCRVPRGLRHRFHFGHPRQLHRREATRRRRRIPKTLVIAVESPEERVTNHAAIHIPARRSGRRSLPVEDMGFSLAEGTALGRAKAASILQRSR